MNSQELWEKLEKTETKEIRVQMSMMIIYLVKYRDIKLKEIIKDIKNISKMVVM